MCQSNSRKPESCTVKAKSLFNLFHFFYRCGNESVGRACDSEENCGDVQDIGETSGDRYSDDGEVK